MSTFNGLKVTFVYRKKVVKDNDWVETTSFYPQVGHRVYLGEKGNYFWYEVEKIEWPTSQAVFVYLINKKSS